MIGAGLVAAVAACAAVGYAQSATAAAASRAPTVDLGYAVYQATINDTGFQYYNFSNIRYGAPPVGNLRFAAPLPPQDVNRTVNNGQQSVICPQAGPAWVLTEYQFLGGTPVNQLVNPSTLSTSDLSFIPKPDPRTSEDCLFLDVIVPKSVFDKADGHQQQRDERESERNGAGKGAPVLVWVYGGGYTGGDKADSGNSASLVASSRGDDGDGVIFIAFNYRLGLFGWLSGPTFQENGTANAGLYDQELLLQWIQKNIHLFGGDPNRVTLIGESAGGGSIMHQITAYGGLKGKVPFQQAILQSPGFQPLNDNAQIESMYQQTLSYASLITGRKIATTQDLRCLSTLELYYTNYAVVGLSSYGTFTYGPTVDGKFVPKLPGELLLHGQYDKSLNIMVGHNLNEGLFFTSPFISDETTFEAFLRAQFPAATAQGLNYITQTLYPPIFNGSQGYTSQLERTALLISEAIFTCNTRFLDLAYSNKTYSYYFTAPPGMHGIDIAYTFFNGDTTTIDGTLPVNATVARALQDYITSFAVRGSPNEAGEPYFPVYGTNSSTEVLGIEGLGTQVKDTAANERCVYWQKALYN